MSLNTNKLKQLLFPYINYKIKDDLLNLANDIASSADASIFIDYKELSTLRNRLDKAVLLLSDSLEADLPDRKEYINELMSLKDSIAEHYKSVCAYTMYLDQLRYVFKYEFELKSYNTLYSREVDAATIRASIDRLMLDYSQFIYAEDQNPVALSEVFSLLPLRMTKEKYSSLIKDSLTLIRHGLGKENLISQLNMYDFTVCPRSSESYGKFFTSICERADSISIDNISEKALEELDEILAELSACAEQCAEVTEILSILFNSVNHLLAIASYCIDEEYLFGEDIFLKDIFYSLCDMLKTKDYEIYAESISDRACDTIEALYEENKATEKALEAMLSECSREELTKLPDDLLTIVEIYFSIRYLYSEEIFMTFEAQAGTDIEDDKIDDEINSFIDKLNAYFEIYPSKVAKLLKQFTFKNFLYPYSEDSLMEHIDHVINSLSKDESIYLCFQALASYADENDIRGNNSFFAEHSHSHHDHHCSCGHNHSHDHNCGCGHHHKH